MSQIKTTLIIQRNNKAKNISEKQTINATTPIQVKLSNLRLVSLRVGFPFKGLNNSGRVLSLTFNFMVQGIAEQSRLLAVQADTHSRTCDSHPSNYQLRILNRQLFYLWATIALFSNWDFEEILDEFVL